jgi:hypothetical protein
VLGFWIAVIAAWAWLSALSIHLYRHVERGPGLSPQPADRGGPK